MFLILVEFLVAVFVILIVYTQIMIPYLQGTSYFPIFTQERKVVGDIQKKQEEKLVNELKERDQKLADEIKNKTKESENA